MRVCALARRRLASLAAASRGLAGVPNDADDAAADGGGDDNDDDDDDDDHHRHHATASGARYRRRRSPWRRAPSRPAARVSQPKRLTSSGSDRPPVPGRPRARGRRHTRRQTHMQTHAPRHTHTSQGATDNGKQLCSGRANLFATGKLLQGSVSRSCWPQTFNFDASFHFLAPSTRPENNYTRGSEDAQGTTATTIRFDRPPVSSCLLTATQNKRLQHERKLNLTNLNGNLSATSRSCFSFYNELVGVRFMSCEKLHPIEGPVSSRMQQQQRRRSPMQRSSC